jgi:hypothetical protein
MHYFTLKAITFIHNTLYFRNNGNTKRWYISHLHRTRKTLELVVMDVMHVYPQN